MYENKNNKTEGKDTEKKPDELSSSSPDSTIFKDSTESKNNYNPIVMSIYSEDKSRANIIMIEGFPEDEIENNYHNIKIITQQPCKNLEPSLSPDKSKILFYSDMDGDYDIYVKDIDNYQDSKPVNITNNIYNDYMPRWSADGSRISYQSDESGSSGIYVINSDGTGKTAVTKDNFENYDPIWSYPGDKLFFISDREGYFDIYMADLNENSIKKFTDDNYYEENLSISPDGSKIAYASGNIESTVFEIFILDLKSEKIDAMTSLKSYSSKPHWVYIGNSLKIIFESDLSGRINLYSMDLKGNNLKNITDNDYENRICKSSWGNPYIFLQSFDDSGRCLLSLVDLEISGQKDLLGDRESFDMIRENETDVLKIFEFIDLNILIAGREYADELTDFAMEFSENELIPFSDNYYEGNMQEKLLSEFKVTGDIKKLANSNDKEIVKLAAETINRKYKLINTGGSICPIMDYSQYKKYSPYLSKQMNDYINIMAIETDHPSIMDAGIAIPLDDFAQRIISYYEFERRYPGFIRIYKIVNILNCSLQTYFGGIDNTPVFDNNDMIIQQRLDGFRQNILKYKNTEFANKLQEYLDLLQSEGYMRTARIEEYIENLVFY
ncbi:MAG: hypothetical protein PHU65_03175 [Actinomycetota bacterium]|nr:hypothetical protein [Actinomycetota bacterium]